MLPSISQPTLKCCSRFEHKLHFGYDLSIPQKMTLQKWSKPNQQRMSKSEIHSVANCYLSVLRIRCGTRDTVCLCLSDNLLGFLERQQQQKQQQQQQRI